MRLLPTGETLALPASDNSPAIIYLETGQEPITITRADLNREVERYGAVLAQSGIKPRDLVIIAHVQNLESIYAFWGTLLIGAVPSMFPTLTEKLDRQKYMDSMALLVKHSEARAVLTTVDFAPEMRAIVGCDVFDSEQLSAYVTQPGVYHTPSPEEIAFLQHSSGTTGLQKGVALSHRAVLNQLASYSDALGLATDDVIVSWLPLYHDMGLIAGFLLPLVLGIPLVLMSPFDWVQHPAMLLKAIDTYGGTFCWLPNFAYNHCARRIRKGDIEGLDLSHVRAYINCSEPVRHSSHQLFLERFEHLGVRAGQLAVSYAMAENTFAVTQTPIGEPANQHTVDRHMLENERRAVNSDAPGALVQVSCGPAIAGVDVCAVDEQGQPLPERHVGEIAIKSNCMLTGYYKRPDLNAHIFTEEGWYLTGDMGYIANGEVYIVGRKKDLIISGGKNVYPQDIEAIVNTIDGVHPGRTVVFGVPDEREGTELIAVIAETSITDKDEQQTIIRNIRRTIAEQTTITATYVSLVDRQWLLKTSSGKIARAAIRDKWLAERP
ncbi:MAG: AMP-binding protein [Chloroflexi bacterium]|nr:AMP-binding protein [Chloroflexota bacterium]